MFEKLFTQPRVQSVSKPLAEQIIPEDGYQYRKPGEDGKPPGDLDIILAGGEQAAPARRGRLNAEAQEAQAGFHQYCRAYPDRGRDENWCNTVREDMSKYYSQI